MSNLDANLKERVFDKVTLADNERTQCEVWTRVMGYHRPLESFNKGKKEEFYERKCFTEEAARRHELARDKMPVEHLDKQVDNALAAE